jgi:hypothetical protein
MNEPYSCKAFLGELLIRTVTDFGYLLFEKETTLLIKEFTGQEPLFCGLSYMINNRDTAVPKILEDLSIAGKKSRNSSDYILSTHGRRGGSKHNTFGTLHFNIIAFLKEKLEVQKQKSDRSSETRWLDFWNGYPEFDRDCGFIEFAYLMSKNNILREFFRKVMVGCADYESELPACEIGVPGFEIEIDDYVDWRGYVEDFCTEKFSFDRELKYFAEEALKTVLNIDESKKDDIFRGDLVANEIIDIDSFTMKKDVVKLLDMMKIIIP